MEAPMADTQGELPPLPGFFTPPGEPDSLLIGLALVFLAVALVGGTYYLRLHSVPDRMAHRANHAQLQLIGILTLLALVTHNNLLWLAALVIAAINPPDLMTPLRSMAASLRRLAGKPEAPGAVDPLDQGVIDQEVVALRDQDESERRGARRA
jgi:hypothetical protein